MRVRTQAIRVRYPSLRSLEMDIEIVENQNLATAGQRAVTIQFSGDYNLTKQLMLRLYFDRRVNTPFISTSFPTANTNAGFALRFQLR